MLSYNPLLALSEAAELLHARLGADFAGVVTFADDDAASPACAVLLAAHGAGAGALERHAIMHGRHWSAHRLLENAAAAAAASCNGNGATDGGGSFSAGGQRLYVPDAAAADPNALPHDFALLHRAAGLRSLVAAPIGPRGAPFGALILGRAAPRAFDDAWSRVWPCAAATGLMQQLRPAQVGEAVRVVRAIDDAPDPVATVSAALDAGAAFMWRATNVAMGVRLALVEPGGAAALVFESAAAAGGSGASAARGRRPLASKSVGAGLGLGAGGAAGAPAAARDVVVREMPLRDTLLASAVAMRKARFVKDCAAYLQNCPSPARDVFTHASEVVASVVCVPLLAAGGGAALGGVYFTLASPCDFSNLQQSLLGFVHCVAPALHGKLAGRMAELRELADRVSFVCDCVYA